MNVFKHMSVKWKIYFIAVISILGFGAYLAFNVWVNSQNAKLLTALRESYFPILEQATQVDVNLDRLAEMLNNAAMTAEAEFVESAQLTANGMNKQLDTIMALEPERKHEVRLMKQEFNEYFAEAKHITLDMLAGDADMAEMVKRAEVKETKLKSLNTRLDTFIAYAHGKFSGSIDDANRNSKYMLTSGFVIWGVCALIMAVTVYAIARIILGNINRVSVSLNEIARGSADFSRKIEVHSEDEIGKLATSFNGLMENLRIKTSDLMSMMHHMHTGLFTITEDESIHREYSSRIEEIYATTQVAGENYCDLMFRHSSLGADVRDQVRAAVTSLLGADEMMFEFNSHLLIKEYSIQMTDENGVPGVKILEVDWDAIVTDDVITKIMVTVRDVTELRAMQAAAEDQKMELEIVGQILKLTPARFSAFADNAFGLIDRNEAIIRQHAQKNLAVVPELFANMHTIKGNARTYQLSYITDTVHETETTYDRLRKDETCEWSQQQLLEELADVRAALQRYVDVLNDKLSFASEGAAAPQDAVVIRKAEFRKLLSQAEPLLADVRHAAVLAPLVNTLRRFDTQPLQDVLAAQLQALPDVAKQLGKEVPQIVFGGDEAAVFSEHANTLANVFSHVLKNSVDHGIEAAADRLAKGKSSQGTIRIEAHLEHDLARIEVYDDGKGLNLERLCEKLSEQGVLGADLTSLTPQRVAEGMFMSGVSTAEKLTDVSGRGVGMDAVKKYLNALGCDINIQLPADASFADAYVPFRLVISLGSNVCLLPAGMAGVRDDSRRVS